MTTYMIRELLLTPDEEHFVGLAMTAAQWHSNRAPEFYMHDNPDGFTPVPAHVLIENDLRMAKERKPEDYAKEAEEERAAIIEDREFDLAKLRTLQSKLAALTRKTKKWKTSDKFQAEVKQRMLDSLESFRCQECFQTRIEMQVEGIAELKAEKIASGAELKRMATKELGDAYNRVFKAYTEHKAREKKFHRTAMKFRKAIGLDQPKKKGKRK